MLLSLFPWTLQPFSGPFPAPSLIGLITTNSLLCSVLLVLGLLFPFPFRIIFGHVFFQRPVLWLIVGPGSSLLGLLVLSHWGTLSELPIGFVWNILYIALLTTLRLARLFFAKKLPLPGGRC